jgi:hypothetical protein
LHPESPLGPSSYIIQTVKEQVMRLTFLFLLGVAGIALFLYSAEKTFFLQQFGNAPNGQIVLFGLTAVLMLVAGVANLFAVWALSFGRLSSVLGSVDSPILVDASGVRRRASRIRVKKNLDEGQSRLPDNEQVVLFISGWRPWSCPASNFLKRDDHT